MLSWLFNYPVDVVKVGRKMSNDVNSVSKIMSLDAVPSRYLIQILLAGHSRDLRRRGFKSLLSWTQLDTDKVRRVKRIL